MTAPVLPLADERPPAAARRGLVGWARANFFSTPFDTAVTLALLYLLWLALPPAYNWLVRDSLVEADGAEQCVRAGGACWAYLIQKYRLILFGTYPYEEQWRPAIALTVFALAVIVSCVPAAWRGAGSRRVMASIWAAVLGLVTWLMWGGLGLAHVSVQRWAGLPLTVLIASVGLFGAFWLAILLALGRRSDMPVVRWASAAAIELMRGVPLVSLLYMATVLAPLLMPPGANVDKLLRAEVVFLIFFAAYMAEVIRGGLQAIPKGQYEAAEAIGFTYWQVQRRIILPQAIRLVIPSLVNIFIAAFKDTSLVIVISMLDLLGTANAAKSDPKWWGLYVESYLFIAAIYLVVCLAMSRYSQYLERLLGVKRHDVA